MYYNSLSLFERNDDEDQMDFSSWFTDCNKSKTDAEIEKERKSYIVRGLSGLNNIGNTCYLNSILQCISSLDVFRSWLKKNKYYDRLYSNKLFELANKFRAENNIDKNTSVYVKSEDIEEACKDSLVNRLAEIMKTLWNENCTITPTSFKKILGENCSTFNGLNQNDSQEVLNLILDKIHEETKAEVKLIFPNVPQGVRNYIDVKNECSKIINDERVPLDVKEQKALFYKNYKKKHQDDVTVYSAYCYWKNYIKKSHSIITDLFTGLFYSKITCCECNCVSNGFEPFNILSIPTKDEGDSTLEECISEFTKEELLTGDNKYFCEECKKNVDALKKMYIWEPPIILIIHLKRFKNDSWRTTKTSSKVIFPIENLNIEPYLSQLHSIKGKRYDLSAISDHKGSCNYVHYIAYCKNSINNKWYEYNDEDIIHFPNENLENELITKNAYILFYVRKD